MERSPNAHFWEDIGEYHRDHVLLELDIHVYKCRDVALRWRSPRTHA